MLAAGRAGTPGSPAETGVIITFGSAGSGFSVLIGAVASVPSAPIESPVDDRVEAVEAPEPVEARRTPTTTLAVPIKVPWVSRTRAVRMCFPVGALLVSNL